MPDNAPSKPDPYWPRGLSRVQAASYIGVGTSLFDTMMKDGRIALSVWCRTGAIEKLVACSARRGHDLFNTAAEARSRQV
jgi:hypothetical protein